MWYNITLVVGVLVLVAALYAFNQSLNFLKTTQRAEATVIKIQKDEDNDGTTYKPIFKFTSYNGEDYMYTYPFGTSNNSWSIGDKATIAYAGDNPIKAGLVTYFGTFGWTIVLMAIAMPLLVIGGGYHLAQPFLK